MLWRAVALLAVLLTGALPRGAAAATAPPRFDLVERVAGDADRPDGVSVSFRGAHGQTRTGVRMPLPGRLAYDATIPAEAVLTLGYALSAAPFMVETPELAPPTRFRIRFEEEDDGGVHDLLDHRLDPARKEGDRRWFDARLDLAALAGKTGRLLFEVENEGDAAGARHADALWSTPRIDHPGAAPGPNLLLITIDCLRADHLGSHGYARDVTPHLDEVAAAGVRFAHAYANAPMTLPSIPQIFTSRVFPTRDHETLTQPIARAGIANAAFVNNAWIPLWFSQGGHADPPGTFDRMVSGELDATEITDRALAWLAGHPRERFALYLHYLDAHTPYRPPRAYIEKYADPSYRGPIGDTFNDNEGADAGRYDEADRKKIVALYDAAIHYVDDQIARILKSLESSGRLDETLVVLSADHGEEFWDHGRFFHGQSLYDELLHVPLIVRLPGRKHAGTVVERPVRSIDIAPSILEWLDLPRPDGFTGASLRDAIDAPDREGPPLFATATQAQFPTRYAIRTRSQKLIESLDSGRREFYEVGRDPAEREDVAPREPPGGAELAESLEEARRILRERGYQLRVVARGPKPTDLRIRLEGHPKSGTFLTLDRRAEGAPPRVEVSPDGKDLTAQVRADTSGTGFRFDRLANPNRLITKDLIRVTVEVDGRPLPRSVWALGADGHAPRTDLIDLRNRSLETTTAPDCPPPDEGVRLCLWRFPGENFLAIPTVEDPAVRKRLRALGYLQ